MGVVQNLISASFILLISCSAFADFNSEICKVSYLYDGANKDPLYKGSFGAESEGNGDYMMIFHSTSPEEHFYYNRGRIKMATKGEVRGFVRGPCIDMFSLDLCKTVVSVEFLTNEQEDNIVMGHLIDANGNNIGRLGGIGGLLGPCE